MKSPHLKALFVTGLSGFLCLSQPALAQSEVVMQTYQAGPASQPLYLASGTRDPAPQPAGETVAQENDFEPPAFSGGKLHQYLGIATVGAAAETFLTHHDACKDAACANLPRDTRGPHAQLGRATAVLALATVASGLLTHWDDFSLEDGWQDPDNMHVMLGVSGAALMAYAINKSWRSTAPVNHSGLAELGAASMIFAIKLTW